MKTIATLILIFFNSNSYAQNTVTQEIINPITKRLEAAAKVLNLPIDGYRIRINYYWEAAEFSMGPDGVLEIAAAYIPALKTQDAVASIIAHELAHMSCSHSIVDIEPLVAEYEADQVGIDMLWLAGFNPSAAIDALKAYDDFYLKTTAGAAEAHDENHPDSDARIKAMEDEIRKVSVGKPSRASILISKEQRQKVLCELNDNMNGNHYEPNSGPCFNP